MKNLTLQEALIALGNGEKVTNNDMTGNGEYIQFRDDDIYWMNGQRCEDLGWTLNTTSTRIYQEPKKMIKVAKYAFDREDGSWDDNNRYYKSDEHFEQLCKHWKNFKRLDYTEIEVEEY